MRLRKIAIGMVAAVATFTFAVCVYTSVQAAASLVSRLTARSQTQQSVVQKAEIPLASVSPEPIFVGPSGNEKAGENEEAQEFDPAGEYYLNQGTVPKAFSDVGYIEIQTHEYGDDANDSETGLLIAPKGSVHTNLSLKLDRIAINGKVIAFQTATVDGVSYKFTGRFLPTDYCETGGEIPDLEGRLIKIKDNKWAAEMKAKFYAECGC